MKRHHWHYRFTWFHLIRPLTLSGTMAPIVAGTMLAAKKGDIQTDLFVALLGATLLIQIATNILNDYYDFLQGQDKDKWTKQSIFATSNRPAHHHIPYVAGVLLFIAALLGLYLIWHTSIWVGVIGIGGIASGYFYSAGRRPLAALGLGEVLAALYLGVIPTVLAYGIQRASITMHAIMLSIPFLLLIAAMVLTNNIRDIDKDRHFRRTIAITLGRERATRLLSTLLLGAYASNILLLVTGVVPWTTLFAFLSLPLALALRWSFRTFSSRTEEQQGMKWAAWHHWVYSIGFVIGMLF